MAYVDMNRMNLWANRTTAAASANTALKLGEDALQANGTRKGWNFIFRYATRDKAANNTVRTELLKSLSDAFGLEGYADKDGKVTFRAGFLADLEKCLGRDAKKILVGDAFGIDDKKGGAVTSGKPLTERRVRAIMNRVGEIAAKGTAEIDKKTLASFNEAKDFTLSDVENGIIGEETGDRIKAFFGVIDRCTKALDELPAKFANIRDDETAKLTFMQLTGMVFHPEYITGEIKTPAVYREYAKSVICEFVNLLMARFAADPEDDKHDSVRIPSEFPCMEGKTSVLQEAKLQKEVGSVTAHGKDTKLSDCIFEEIGHIRKERGDDVTWAEAKPILVKRLVGLTRPVDSAKGEELAPVSGKPRKVTAKDIDHLAPYIKMALVMD